MDSARLQVVEALFHAALEVDPGGRDAFLRERCAGDDALRRDVDALLAADASAGAFIAAPIATLDGRLFDDEEPDRLVGQAIGHWEILKRIGSGGMGAVYLARRADRQFEQQVALKLIKRGMDTDAVLRRFRNERQILAGLDHPNIARLLDGDTTADGLPYFVMEYVEGLPIDQYCERHALPVDARLRLFREVCAAVSHAHRHAVIHRDLKPSNILVSGEGVPKLLDFGIARLVQPGGTPEAAATMMELRALTPEYASPEQVRGEPLTTASDVYSLGVVLYRLLTGELPQRGAAHATQEPARTLSETAIPKPSARVDAAGARRLRGDLDNIVLMALRQEPERRYASVDQLSDDLRRHLAALPVLARRDTFAYRAGKFVRRNTAASVAAALVILSLVGGIVATTWQAKRARAQEAIALAEKAKAEHRFNEVRQLARAVIFDYHDAVRDLPGATSVRERLVRDGLAYVDSLAGEAAGDPALQRELAGAYERLGDVRGEADSVNLGDLAGALESYGKALAIREALVASNPGDAQDRRNLARAQVRLGSAMLDTAEADRGIVHLRRGVANYQALAEAPGAEAQLRRDYWEALDALGLALENSELDEALAIHRKTVALREAAVAEDPDDASRRRALAVSYINQGRALVLKDETEAALASNRKSIDLSAALYAENPEDAGLRRLYAVGLQNDGDYRSFVGDLPGALRSFREKLVLDEKALAEDPANAQAHSDLAYTSQRIGAFLADSGDHAQALPHFRRALAIYGRLSADSPKDLGIRHRVVANQAMVCELLARLGKRDGAQLECSAAIALLDVLPEDPADYHRSALRTQAYIDVAEAYVVLAGSPGLTPADQAGHWRTACDLWTQSLPMAEDMLRRGFLTGVDTEVPATVAREIKRCNAALSKPAG